MPEVNTAVVGGAVAQAPVEVLPDNPKPRKTVTNWSAIYDTKLYPTQIKCEGYFPMQGFGEGCHTTMQLKPEQLAAHLDGGHGGGFHFSFRQGVQNDPIGARDIKVGFWEGWKKFEELGVELRDLRCAICNEEIPVNSRGLIRHCKPHAGNSTRVRPGGDFWLTLARDIPQESLEDEI